MNQFSDRYKRALLALLLICAVLFTWGCATTPNKCEDLPPILTQDELLRPYQNAGGIEVRRSRYGSPADFVPDDYSWAYLSLRKEAARIGADAVIFPEVKVQQEIYLFFPTSEIKAKGTAINFR